MNNSEQCWKILLMYNHIYLLFYHPCARFTCIMYTFKYRQSKPGETKLFQIKLWTYRKEDVLKRSTFEYENPVQSSFTYVDM